MSTETIKAARKFALGDRVTKSKGASWQGRVVGFYSTSLTPIGYAVESEREPGSVQIYPETALSHPPVEPGDQAPENHLQAVTYSQEECDELCEIAKRDGYEEAVQDIDQRTGGDGEYRYCLGMEDDIRHQPDAATMIQRIVDRFEVLNLLDEATKDGRDQPDDGPAPQTNVGGLNEAAIDAACTAGLKAAVSATGLYRKEIEAAVTAYLLVNNALCSDCPRVGHSTDATRCDECPRRSPSPIITDTDRLKIPRLTAAWGGIANAPEALDEAALKAAKDAMVEATGLSPMWGAAAAWAGARAAVTAYLAAISGDRP